MGTTPQAEITTSALSDADIQRLATALAPYVQRAGTPDNQQEPALVHGRQDGAIFRNGPANVSKPADISQQTIELVQHMTAQVARSGVNVGTGYVGYDLKTPAATLVPFMTPLINMTPREGGVGVPVHNWKAITDLFGGSGAQGVIGAVADGGTPTFLSRTVVPMSNTFQTIGFQDSLTFAAEWRGRQLEGDMRAMIASQVLFGLKMVEENWLINMSDLLWTPPPILMSAVNSGGTITNASNGTMWFIVTAHNANGETLGTALQSVTIPGTTSSITLTIFTVPNATYYNVYAAQNTGSTPANSAMWLQSALTQFGNANALNQPANPIQGSFTATMTAPPATSGTAYSSVVSAGNTAQVAKDTNNNSITWKGALGLIYANYAANSGNATGSLKSQVIQPAATTGYLALQDIQNLFLYMYQNARANPTHLFVSPQDSITISNLVSANGNIRVTVDASKPELQGQLQAGYRVGRILNEVTQSPVEIVPLPYLAQGTIMAGSYSFPFPIAGFSQDPFRIITNREYYGVEYPPTQQNPTQWGWGAFVDNTVVNEYLGGWGLISGIVYH